MAKVKDKCAVCRKSTNEGICTECVSLGWWFDPAGGLHEPQPITSFEDAEFDYEGLMYE